MRKKIFTFLLALAASVGLSWATVITWDQSKVSSMAMIVSSGSDSRTSDGITVTAVSTGEFVVFGDHGGAIEIGNGEGSGGGYLTFTSSVGNIAQIDIYHSGAGEWRNANGDWISPYYENFEGGIFTWSGTPAASITLTGDAPRHIDDITSIEFTIEDGGGSTQAGLQVTELQVPGSWADNPTMLSTSDMPGFSAVSYEEAAAWDAAPAGEVALIFAFEENGATSLSFKNGVYQAAQAHNITYEDLYAWYSDGEKIFYTGGGSTPTPTPAESVTVVFEANNNQKEVEVTLPHTFACDFQNGNGELDGIIQELYALQYGGYCPAFDVPTATGNAAVTASKDGNNHYIAISEAFEGTATVTGNYIKYLDTEYMGSTSVDYTLTISVQGSTSATGLQVVEVTSDIYDGWNSNSNTFTVDALPGFQAVTFDEAKEWTGVPTSGTAALVYRTNGDYARVIHFFDGDITGDYDLETSFNQMYENITIFGNRIFYTAGGGSTPDPTPTPSADGDKLAGAFSVGGDKVVYFSKANLQATTSDQGATWTWGFAEHQWDYVGNSAANNAINGGGTVSTNGPVDLFAWSSTDNNYFGINNSINEADNSGDFKDWGAKKGSDWRTLTINEWQYLLQDRNPGSLADGTSNPRYTNAQILTDGTAPQKDIKGIILFPDDFNDGGESIDGVTWGSINPSFFSSYPTTCTTAGWATLESMGCVFLPSAGSRQNFGDEFAILNVNQMGNYWSSTLYSGEPEDPQSIAVGDGSLGIGTNPRYWGMSVRLVSETAPSGGSTTPEPSGTTVTWDLSDMASMGTQGGYFKAKGITLMAYGVDNGMTGDGIYGGAYFGGPFVFTTSLGKFTKIEVTNSYLYDQPAFSGDGWTLDGTNAVWEGTPAALVSLVSNFGGITQIKFTIDPNTSTPANSCGDGLTWAVNDGELTISYDGVGTGSMDNYDGPLSMPWYGQNITSVVLPEGLISIGQNAFAFINTFSQITLPSTLQYILMNAFSGCGLTSVTIPENVKGISASAFISSQSLATVTFEPTTPPRVGGNAFEYCHNDLIIHYPCESKALYYNDMQADIAYYHDKMYNCPAPSGDEGKLLGAFTINSNGDQIVFSKGNLQYHCTNHVWQFATNQYDIIGGDNANISDSYDGWIDLFGYGTGNNPTLVSTSYGDYSTFTDWGVNAISNGGNEANLWRTLTAQEWVYMFRLRTEAHNKYGAATVANVPGIIVLPDVYVGPAINTVRDAWDNNVISSSEWAAYEAAGAVFLPAAGYRSGTTMYNVGSEGFCWSSTPDPGDAEYSYKLCLSPISVIEPQGFGRRNEGISVRLIKAASAQDIADVVIALINAIPNPVAYNDECKDAIDAARAAYDALTDAQKDLVENYGDLLDAETAYAQSIPHPNGECGAQGNNLLWDLDPSTGVLTITGSGAMNDWPDDTNLPWYDNRLQITSVVLPSGITSIGEKAFRGCNNLASINMTENYPAGLTAINQEAFCNTKLTSVTIPESVVTIGMDAFYLSQAITDVYCYADPNNLTWNDYYRDDFKKTPAKSTQCHVKDCHLDVFNTNWNTGNTTDVNVTFVGDLPGDCGGSTPANPVIKLNANFGGTYDWADTEAFTDNGDGTATLSNIALEFGYYYNFRVKVDGVSMSDNHEFTRQTPSCVISSGSGDVYYFQADVTGNYSFTWEYATNTLTIDYPEIQHTYTAMGQNLAIFGNSWDASITANDLVLQEDGSYKWEKENVPFTGAITIQYRVCKDHAWDVVYPATSEDAATFEIPSLGDYKITITYNPVGNVVSASAEKIAKPTIQLNGNFSGEWADTEAFEVVELPMHSYAKLTKLLEPGTYEFGVKVNDEWRANGSAYTRDNYSYIIEEGHTGNLTINVDVKGYYSFFWYYDDNRLTIDYSRVCGMYWKDVTAGNFEVTLGQEGEVTLPKVWATSGAFVSNIANGVDQVRLGSTDETVATIAYTLSMDGLGTLTFHQAGECDIYVVHDITNLYCYDSCAFHLTVHPAAPVVPVYTDADFAIDFRNDPYQVTSGSLPTGTEVEGTPHSDISHGYTNVVITIPVTAGNYKVTMGTCKYSGVDGAVKTEDGSYTYATLATNTGYCYHQNTATNVVSAIFNVPSDQIIKVYGAEYTPYFAIEKMAAVPAFTDFELNFQTNPYNVISGAKPEGTVIIGTYHDNLHGYQNVEAVVPVKAGNYRLTVGACEYGTPGNVMSETNAELASFNSNLGEGNCYHNNTAENIVSTIFTVDMDQTITINGGEYMPYMKLEKLLDNTYYINFENAEGAIGTVPGEIAITAGDSWTIPANLTLYKEGYTFVGWSDGVNTYAPGDEFFPSAHGTLHAVYTPNSVSVADASTINVKWYFGESNGAPSVTWNGAAGYLLAKGEVDGQLIDLKLDINATSGKFHNAGRGDKWAQVNANTVFTFPSKEGALVNVETYSGNATYDLAAGTLTCNTNDYYSYLEIVYPAPTTAVEIGDPNDADQVTAFLTTYDGQEIDELTIDRPVLNNMYNTLCLPFHMDADQIAASSLNGVEIYEFVDVDVTNDELYLYTSEEKHEIVAGRPYLVKFSAASQLDDLDFVNVTINNADLDDQAVTIKGVTFKGTFQPIVLGKQTELDFNGGHLFLMANNTLMWPNTDNPLKPFRAYFTVNVDAGQSAGMPVRRGMPAHIGGPAQILTGVDQISQEPGQTCNSQKLMENGVLYIIKNGVKYNAQGQVVK